VGGETDGVTLGAQLGDVDGTTHNKTIAKLTIFYSIS
jgi:hypothetical protein